MALVFQVRGTQLDAYYARGFKAWGKNSVNGQTPALVANAGTGVFGGSVIDIRPVSGTNAITYHGGLNFALGAPFKVLMRILPTWTGNPGATHAGFTMLHGDFAGGYGVWTRFASNGTVQVICRDANGAVTVNNNTAGTVPWVSGVPMDIFLVWDGTTSAGAVKVFYQAQGESGPTQIGTFTASTAVSARLPASIGTLTFGYNSFENGNYYINEIAIWDDATDPTGARTDFETATNYEGFATATASDIKHDAIVTGVTGTYRGYDLWETVPAASIASGESYLQDGATLTGSLVTGTDPSVSDVRLGVSWINGSGNTVTGTLVTPTIYTGTASLVNFAQIKENVRYFLEQANTTTADFDLSNGLSKRVKKVMSRHPGKLLMSASEYPYVSMFIDSKNIEMQDIAINQKNARRRHTIKMKIVGAVWNNQMPNKKLDAADDSCEQLMENIEEVLRRQPTLGGECLWHISDSVTYHGAFDEEAHLRVGILSFDIVVQT